MTTTSYGNLISLIYKKKNGIPHKRKQRHFKFNKFLQRQSFSCGKKLTTSNALVFLETALRIS